MSIGTSELVFILVPLTLISWPLSLAALVSLCRRQLVSVLQALWVPIILIIPVLGPVAYWAVRPGKNQQ